MRSRFLGIRLRIAVLAASAIGVALVAACSTHGKAAGMGEQCFAATDCQDGLVCVPQPDGRMACTNDISGIVNVEDSGAAPMDARVRDGEAGTVTDGMPPPQDAPAQDTAPPQDSSPPPDATD